MIKVPLLRHQRYISPSPLTPRVKNQRPSKKPTTKRTWKKSWLWHFRWTCYGQFYWTKLSGYHIHTKYCIFDYSEMLFGPFEKMTFFGEYPLPMGPESGSPWCRRWSLCGYLWLRPRTQFKLIGGLLATPRPTPTPRSSRLQLPQLQANYHMKHEEPIAA